MWKKSLLWIGWLISWTSWLTLPVFFESVEYFTYGYVLVNLGLSWYAIYKDIKKDKFFTYRAPIEIYLMFGLPYGYWHTYLKGGNIDDFGAIFLASVAFTYCALMNRERIYKQRMKWIYFTLGIPFGWILLFTWSIDILLSKAPRPPQTKKKVSLTTSQNV
jgi:hypothetical protein